VQVRKRYKEGDLSDEGSRDVSLPAITEAQVSLQS
jgi:hypothetical protein